MKNLISFIFLLHVIFYSHSQEIREDQQDIDSIKKILANQVNYWNEGNLEGFMSGYAVIDSLMFIGNTGITYGWRSTLDRYKAKYNTPEKMGKLKFNLLEIKRLSPNYIFVVGQWKLNRSKEGDVSGHFSLLWKRMSEGWLIIADHSS